jgi:hypothetical protein
MWRQGVRVDEIAHTVGRTPASIYGITTRAGAYKITG